MTVKVTKAVKPRPISYMGLGKFLRDATTHLTTDQFAEMLGFTASFVADVMNCKRGVSPEGCDLIARKLRLTEKQKATLHRHAGRFNGFN